MSKSKAIRVMRERVVSALCLAFADGLDPEEIVDDIAKVSMSGIDRLHGCGALFPALRRIDDVRMGKGVVGEEFRHPTVVGGPSKTPTFRAWLNELPDEIDGSSSPFLVPDFLPC